jgi:hypothetical protein
LLIAAIEADAVDVVIVRDSDRLTRNPAAFPSRRNTRAAASVVGGDGAAWLEGHAAKASCATLPSRPWSRLT